MVEWALDWCDAEVRNDIEYAVGEALAAAVLRCTDDRGYVDVLCERLGSVFVVDVTEPNGSYDLSDLEHETDTPAAAIGYGIVIMHELMDEVEYADRGRSVRMIKRCG